MSLNKAIANNKEHRKSYRGPKAIDCNCRNHGSCTWCLENRLYKLNKELERMDSLKKEFEEDNGIN